MNKTYRAATIRANSFDQETNSISIVWTTGASVRRADPYTGDEFDEVLSLDDGAVNLDRLNSGTAPLLDTHRGDEIGSVVGVVLAGSAKIEDGCGIATVLLSKAPGVSDTTQKIREGVARGISVGYTIDHSVRQDGDPPTVLVDKWTPLEISVVPVPADAGSQIRSEQRQRPRDRQTPTQRAAAYARHLLQPTQSREQAHGASEARAALGSIGRLAPVDKVGKMDRRAVENGAREARKLLRGRQ